MRLFRPSPIVLGVGLGLVACGGTSSETPWPVEPESRPLGPSGETAPPPAIVTTAEPEQTDAGVVRKRRPPEPNVEP